MSPSFTTDANFDEIGELANPHVLLPSQWRETGAISPEQRLWWAVLSDAIRCFHGKAQGSGGLYLRNGGRAAVQREARRWFESRDHLSDAFSFEAICEGLELDADVVRERVFSGQTELPKRRTGVYAGRAVPR